MIRDRVRWTVNPLDRLIPHPRLYEVDEQDVAAPVDAVWNYLRHANLAQSGFIRALFALRNLASREPAGAAATIRLDDMRSSPERRGFQVLIEDPPRDVAAGAIGKVWRLAIPFVHVPDAHGYASFAQPGFVKVAWGLHVRPCGVNRSRVEVEVRVDATDETSWRKFRWYFTLIGPFSRYIRRSLLRNTAKQMSRAASPSERLRPHARH